MSLETYKGKIFDSREEVWMAMWLEELKENDYVEEWVRVTLPIELIPAVEFSYNKVTKLKTKYKTEEKKFTLLNNLSYTPDFKVKWTEKGWDRFVSVVANGLNPKSWFFGTYEANGWTNIEVKPTFDQHGKTAKFLLIQKILWKVNKIFVDLIIPEKLFEETFLPKEAMWEFKYKKNPTGKNKGLKTVGDWKMHYTPKTLNEFLNEKD